MADHGDDNPLLRLAQPAEPPLTTYRPNPMQDYFRGRAVEEQSKFNSDLMYLPIHLGIGGVSLAQSAPGWGGPVSRGISRLIGLGSLGIAGAIDVPGIVSAGRKIPEMKRGAEMWDTRNTGLPGSPDPAERGVFERPPQQTSDELMRKVQLPVVPNSGMANEQLETVRHPGTGEVLYVPKGTQWEHDGLQWRLKMPGR